MSSIKDLFSKDYRIINAVNNISMEIMSKEILRYLDSNDTDSWLIIKIFDFSNNSDIILK